MWFRFCRRHRFGALDLTAVKVGNLTTTTTTIGGETPATPVYVAGGASVTFSVTVAASTGTAIGNVTVSLDGGTGAVYPLNSSGIATVVLTGLTAGTHSLAATYATQGGVSGSNSGPFSFSVAKAMTTVTWVPTTLTEQYSQAIGVGVFNATSGGVAGAFVYSATPSGGTAIAVDSSSYLPIGSYSLAVVFTPDGPGGLRAFERQRCELYGDQGEYECAGGSFDECGCGGWLGQLYDDYVCSCGAACDGWNHLYTAGHIHRTVHGELSECCVAGIGRCCAECDRDG